MIITTGSIALAIGTPIRRGSISGADAKLLEAAQRRRSSLRPAPVLSLASLGLGAGGGKSGHRVHWDAQVQRPATTPTLTSPAPALAGAGVSTAAGERQEERGLLQLLGQVFSGWQCALGSKGY